MRTLPVRMEAQLLKKPHGMSDALGMPRGRPWSVIRKPSNWTCFSVRCRMIESFPRIIGSLLETQAALRRFDGRIRGRVFSGFPAMTLGCESTGFLASHREEPAIIGRRAGHRAKWDEDLERVS